LNVAFQKASRFFDRIKNSSYSFKKLNKW